MYNKIIISINFSLVNERGNFPAMKKSILLALICVTLLFCSFVAGFYTGRAGSHNDVQLSVVNTPNPLAPTENTSITATQNFPININTATSQQLQQLKGIGEVKANSIIAYRTQHGPFQSVQELLNVSGIGEKTLAAILDKITV